MDEIVIRTLEFATKHLALLNEYREDGQIHITDADIAHYKQAFNWIVATRFTSRNFPSIRFVMCGMCLLHTLMYIKQHGEPILLSLAEVQRMQRMHAFVLEDIDNILYSIAMHLLFPIIVVMEDGSNTVHVVSNEEADFMYAFILQLLYEKKIACMEQDECFNYIADGASKLYNYDVDRRKIETILTTLNRSNKAALLYQELTVRIMQGNPYVFACDEGFSGLAAFEKIWTANNHYEHICGSMTDMYELQPEVRDITAAIAFYITNCVALIDSDQPFRVCINRAILSPAGTSLFIDVFGRKGIYSQGRWTLFDDVWNMLITFTAILSAQSTKSETKYLLNCMNKILRGNFTSDGEIAHPGMRHFGGVFHRTVKPM
jgi:hypothetical protein